jgi:DNA-binding response OmpR family regulator
MKKHIVIIEDEPLLMQVLQNKLSPHYHITALPQVDNIDDILFLRPDVFLLDEILPVINGHLLCIILKSKAQTRDIPVLLMSGHPQLEHYASLCNADHYLTKPLNFDNLVSVLNRLTHHPRAK